MTFRPAQCPTCGGSLQVPDDHATVKCLYCGGAVIVREAIQAAAAASIPNLLKLARTAASSQNYQEAYDYFSRVLELDGDNSAAWVGRGEAAGWLTRQTSGIPEMVNCFRNAIEVATDQSRKDIQEKVADVTCRITRQTFSNMHSDLSPAFAEEKKWHLYLESLGILIRTLDTAHNLVPQSTLILRSALFLCENNLGKLKYINYRTGRKASRELPPDWDSYIRGRQDYFSKKLFAIDPSARPIETESTGRSDGVVTRLKRRALKIFKE